MCFLSAYRSSSENLFYSYLLGSHGLSFTLHAFHFTIIHMYKAIFTLYTHFRIRESFALINASRVRVLAWYPCSVCTRSLNFSRNNRDTRNRYTWNNDAFNRILVAYLELNVIYLSMLVWHQIQLFNFKAAFMCIYIDLYVICNSCVTNSPYLGLKIRRDADQLCRGTNWIRLVKALHALHRIV